MGLFKIIIYVVCYYYGVCSLPIAYSLDGPSGNIFKFLIYPIHLCDVVYPDHFLDTNFTLFENGSHISIEIEKNPYVKIEQNGHEVRLRATQILMPPFHKNFSLSARDVSNGKIVDSAIIQVLFETFIHQARFSKSVYHANITEDLNIIFDDPIEIVYAGHWDLPVISEEFRDILGITEDNSTINLYFKVEQTLPSLRTAFQNNITVEVPGCPEYAVNNCITTVILTLPEDKNITSDVDNQNYNNITLPISACQEDLADNCTATVLPNVPEDKNITSDVDNQNYNNITLPISACQEDLADNCTATVLPNVPEHKNITWKIRLAILIGIVLLMALVIFCYYLAKHIWCRKECEPKLHEEKLEMKKLIQGSATVSTETAEIL